MLHCKIYRGNLCENGFVGINGEPVERTPVEYPYSYDPYVLHKSPDCDPRNSCIVYSDRMMQWNYDKYMNCIKMMPEEDQAGQMFHHASLRGVSLFLSYYYVKVCNCTAILEGCNVSNGYPYWIFYYTEEET